MHIKSIPPPHIDVKDSIKKTFYLKKVVEEKK